MGRRPAVNTVEIPPARLYDAVAAYKSQIDTDTTEAPAARLALFERSPLPRACGSRPVGRSLARATAFLFYKRLSPLIWDI